LNSSGVLEFSLQKGRNRKNSGAKTQFAAVKFGSAVALLREAFLATFSQDTQTRFERTADVENRPLSAVALKLFAAETAAKASKARVS
jgi:hypothetical protein